MKVYIVRYLGEPFLRKNVDDTRNLFPFRLLNAMFLNKKKR